MFFADEEIAVDFESEVDLLKNPDWTYNRRMGEVAEIYSMDQQGFELYQKFFKNIKEDPDKYLFKTIEEGIERMETGQVAIQIMEKNLRLFYKQNPSGPRPNLLKNDNNDNGNTENFIFTQNSPLTPIFKVGSLELYESGVMKILEEKWMGKELKSKVSDHLHTVVLDLGQMSMVFLLLGSAILFSIIILGVELVWDLIFRSNDNSFIL